MKIKSLLLIAALFLSLPLSCKSPAADLPCTCGTAMTDMEGCAHALCSAGKNNPDNHDCVCGTIEIPSAKKE